ncbi:MAG: hypothetical protein ACR2O2_06235 [Ruegeria sp.]
MISTDAVLETAARGNTSDGVTITVSTIPISVVAANEIKIGSAERVKSRA